MLLFHRAICAYAGITGTELLEAARAKMAYNSKRKDHNVNGDAEAERDPAAELPWRMSHLLQALISTSKKDRKSPLATFHHPV